MSPEPDLDAARRQLAEGQEALLRALVAAHEPPAGFDAARVRLAADSLVAKRTRAAARTWPALARALGPSFGTRFAAFAARTPLPRQGGALADGLGFVRSLPRPETGRLDDAAPFERLGVVLRYRRAGRDGSLVPRRGPAAAGAWLGQSRRWVVAVRVPPFGPCWLSLPCPGRRVKRSFGSQVHRPDKTEGAELHGPGVETTERLAGLGRDREPM